MISYSQVSNSLLVRAACGLMSLEEMLGYDWPDRPSVETYDEWSRRIREQCAYELAERLPAGPARSEG
jgi:hypothetical protein